MMRSSLSLRRLSKGAFARFGTRFGADAKGIAATEFAMLLPTMLVIFVGVTEVGQAISISQKVTNTARTVTDLVTQYTALSSTDMSNILNASTEIIAPYAISNVTVVVSEITTDTSNNATVAWSVALNGTGYTTGTKVTLPSGLIPANTSGAVIWGQVTYHFVPLFGDGIIGPISLSDQFYMDPRNCTTGTAIAYPNSSGSQNGLGFCQQIGSSS